MRIESHGNKYDATLVLDSFILLTAMLYNITYIYFH